MIENGKKRHTVWLTDEAWNMVGGEYKADGCSTQNEYIEKAIRFYTGYRKADRNERYLTDAISGVLETRLGALGDRIGKLLFKMAVEESMMMLLLAMDESLTFSELEPLRKWAIRKLVLPPAVVEVFREYRKTAKSRWLFPSPKNLDMPLTPGSMLRRLHIILERAGCKQIRFHDLRHTFATMALENGMDIKTLSAILGHVSAATTLDIYTHITSDMLSEAAAKIDRGLGNEVAENSAEANPLTDFQPVMRRTRKPGTGCIAQINDHLFEGRYSPTWPDGTKHSKCIYAHTREECEEKLKVLIQQLNAERKAILDRLRGIPSPEKLTKKQRQIWEYMKIYPDETNYSTIAKGANVTRHTVAKWYEMIKKILVNG